MEGSDFADFIAGVEDSQGSAPEAPGLAALGGDVLAVITAAVEAAGSTDPAAIGEALAGLEDIDVVTGQMTYAGNEGIPSKTVSIVTVEGGAFDLVDQFVPETIPTP